MIRTLTALLAAVLVIAGAPAKASPPPNFAGSYELAGKRTDRFFSVDIKQDGKRAKINFSASMSDGSGAAPDADGSGKIEDGVLSFKFTDSFNNQGTGKLQLQQGKPIYQLDLVVTKVADTSPVHFYGTLLLTKVSAQPMRH